MNDSMKSRESEGDGKRIKVGKTGDGCGLNYECCTMRYSQVARDLE